MKYVEQQLNEKMQTQSGDECADEKCYIPALTEDEIGDCGKAFNALVHTLSDAYRLETSMWEFTELLSSQLELDQLAEAALSKLIDHMKASGGAIIIEREGQLKLLSSYGVSEPQKMLDSDMILQVFKHQNRQVMDLPEGLQLNGVLLDYQPKSVLLSPFSIKAWHWG